MHLQIISLLLANWIDSCSYVFRSVSFKKLCSFQFLFLLFLTNYHLTKFLDSILWTLIDKTQTLSYFVNNFSYLSSKYRLCLVFLVNLIIQNTYYLQKCYFRLSWWNKSFLWTNGKLKDSISGQAQKMEKIEHYTVTCTATQRNNTNDLS